MTKGGIKKIQRGFGRRRIHRHYRYSSYKQLKSVIIMVIILLAIITPVIADGEKGKKKKKGKGHDDQEHDIVDISLYSNSLEFGQNIPVPGFEMDIYADDVFSQTLISDEFGFFNMFTFEFGVDYTYEIALFGQADYLTGTLTPGVMTIEIPTFHLTLTYYYDGTTDPIPFLDLCFGMEDYHSQVYTIPIWLQTDANGQIVINQALHGILAYGFEEPAMFYEVRIPSGFEQLTTMPTETESLYLVTESLKIAFSLFL